MLTFNREQLRDKIYACWVGKNIGGTMGTPYEGRQQLNDIQGFVTQPGEVLPNDDLDLQLVWLRAMDEMGPEAIDSKLLAEYWISFIGPSWNEYGLGKSNLRAGIVPPMSGELYNEEWKHSNGAWIRTEVWACTHPGCPDKAIRCAFEDACVDHGFGEGAYAAIFVAAMQSAAFVIDDLRALIDIGLSKVPETCLLARYIRATVKAYDDGMTWQDCREMLLHMNDETGLGWFQAPGNVAFTILGLLWGECDFKKSMIIAIDCGDDTDCTGATVGSLLGIMYGMKAIPEDWRRHIGDRIVTVSIINGHGYFPKSCTELTNCVISLLGATMRTPNGDLAAHGPQFKLTDGESDFGGLTAEQMKGGDFAASLAGRARYSFTADNCYAHALVEFEHEPIIAAGGELRLRLTATLRTTMADQKLFAVRFYLPEDWQALGKKHVHASMPIWSHDNVPSSLRLGHSTTEITLVAGEQVDAVNRAVIELSVAGRPTPLLIPLTILG